MEASSTGEALYDVFESYLRQHSIPIENVISCATDGAAVKTGCHRGFVSRLKRQLPNVIIHCMLHRHNLVAKGLSGELFDTMQLVIMAVNFIKMKPKAARLFKKFCEDADEDFYRLLMHTEVRWFSKGRCLERVGS